MKVHASKYKDLKERALYKDPNDKSSCWVTIVNGQPLVRRQSDGWFKIAPLWELAELSVPDRNHIIENYIKKGPHDRRLGAGTNGGLWVPVDRARTVSRQLKLLPVLSEILDITTETDGSVPLISDPDAGVVKDVPAAAAAAAAAAQPEGEDEVSEIFKSMPSVTPRKRGRPPKVPGSEPTPKKSRSKDAEPATWTKPEEEEEFAETAEWKGDKDFAPGDSPESAAGEKPSTPRGRGRPKGSTSKKAKATSPVRADLTEFLDKTAFNGTVPDLKKYMRDEGVGALILPGPEGAEQIYLIRKPSAELAAKLKDIL